MSIAFYYFRPLIGTVLVCFVVLRGAVRGPARASVLPVLAVLAGRGRGKGKGGRRWLLAGLVPAALALLAVGCCRCWRWKGEEGTCCPRLLANLDRLAFHSLLWSMDNIELCVRLRTLLAFRRSSLVHYRFTFVRR